MRWGQHQTIGCYRAAGAFFSDRSCVWGCENHTSIKDNVATEAIQLDAESSRPQPVIHWFYTSLKKDYIQSCSHAQESSHALFISNQTH